MLQHGIGVALGGLATIILLLIFAGGTTQDYVAPVVAGALVGFFWPIAIGWYLVRRHRQKEQDKIQSEVERQMAGGKPKGN